MLHESNWHAHSLRQPSSQSEALLLMFIKRILTDWMTWHLTALLRSRNTSTKSFIVAFSQKNLQWYGRHRPRRHKVPPSSFAQMRTTRRTQRTFRRSCRRTP